MNTPTDNEAVSSACDIARSPDGAMWYCSTHAIVFSDDDTPKSCPMSTHPTDNGAQRPDMATAIANEVYSYWEHMPGNEGGDFGPTWGVIKALVDQGIEKGKSEAEQTIATLREQLDEAKVTIGQLVIAADAYAADQDYATDQRCGLVQPISVEEGRALNQAIRRGNNFLTRHAEKGET